MNTPATTVKEVLIAAQWILKNVGWTRGSLARTSRGKPIGPREKQAACFCAMGAIEAVRTSDEGGEYPQCSVLHGQALAYAINAAVKVNGVHSIVTSNDTAGTVDEVLALFDVAIASLP